MLTESFLQLALGYTHQKAKLLPEKILWIKYSRTPLTQAPKWVGKTVWVSWGSNVPVRSGSF